MKTRCGAEGQIRQQMEPANQENSRFRPLGFRQPDVRTGVATTFHRHNAHCANRGFHVRTADKITPSVALGGRDRGFSDGSSP